MVGHTNELFFKSTDIEIYKKDCLLAIIIDIGGGGGVKKKSYRKCPQILAKSENIIDLVIVDNSNSDNSMYILMSNQRENDGFK